jgi:hypothetical protein
MGIIVSIYNLGCFTGCIFNFVVAEWLGRRRAMWVAMTWIIVRCCDNSSLRRLSDQTSRLVPRCKHQHFLLPT